MIKAQILLGYHFYMFAIQNLLPKKYRRLDRNMQHIHICLQDTLGYVLVTLNADMDNIVTTQCVTSLPTTVIVDVRSILFYFHQINAYVGKTYLEENNKVCCLKAKCDYGQLYGYKMIFLMYSLSSLDVLLMKTVRLTIIYGS